MIFIYEGTNNLVSGAFLKCFSIQIGKTQREHMVNRVSSYFPKRWPLISRKLNYNNINKRNVKTYLNSDTKNRQQRTTIKLPPDVDISQLSRYVRAFFYVGDYKSCNKKSIFQILQKTL